MQTQSLQLDWKLALAVLNVRLVGVEQDGFSSDYRIGGELRFYLNGIEIVEARQTVPIVEPLSRGGTRITLGRPIAANRVLFIANVSSGRRHGEAAPVAPVSYTHLDVYKRQTQYCTDVCTSFVERLCFVEASIHGF